MGTSGQVGHDSDPRTKEDMEEVEPMTQVIYKTGSDPAVESEVRSEVHLPFYSHGGYNLLMGEQSMSCLSVPVTYTETQIDLSNSLRTQGLCSSMPGVRIDPVEQRSRLGLLHRSASFIPPPGEQHSETSFSTHHLLSPKAMLTPVLRQLCSSIHCIRQATQTPISLEKSHSMPDFSSQVTSVFGSPYKVLMSFLSVTTLKETLSSVLGVGGEPNSGSEALLVLQSLQKISLMEDEEQQRASLARLQSCTSNKLRDNWTDFQERSNEVKIMASATNTPSTTKQFALDVLSVEGDDNEQQFGINEFMEELNMPQELRDEISLLVHGIRKVRHDMRSPKEITSRSNNSETRDFCRFKGQHMETANKRMTELEEDKEVEVGKDQSHSVEISQELLDFFNLALKSSTLMFTFDPEGKLHIEPIGATRVGQTKQMFMSTNDNVESQYGLTRLPSPNSSDLSDYRPDTSSSGSYKTQGSVDLSTECGEGDQQDKAESQHNRLTSDQQRNARTTSLEIPTCNLSSQLFTSPENYKRNGGNYKSCDSGSKVTGLLYISRSSLLTTGPGPELDAIVDQDWRLLNKGHVSNELGLEHLRAAECKGLTGSSDGVLIDHGRWLLKENHLIRKSPPVTMEMYDDVDSTSGDTSLDDISEETHLSSSLHHSASGQEPLPQPLHQPLHPLAVLSSSDLENMARPPTPKCTYFNMSHSSDSEPFLDNLSVNDTRNGARMSAEGKGQGSKVRSKTERTVDTSQTWARKNSSISSFTSVEFRLPDGKVHPEAGLPGATAAVEQSCTSAVSVSRRGRTLQVQDNLEDLHVINESTKHDDVIEVYD
ncbi:hypothetical protein DPEC_G00053520 [Dallia pectoralis]|uniref:Uncharacterized protein n=1 Tax=Dallia pectoralis TaxID=75939 RepID=A0ACC2H5F0_DALPE|nr:hypothetical protein DPEC_G00053520 [Dallia pectoralis]